MLLEIKNLWVKIEEKTLLKGLNLAIPKGEIHAIMGPNGAGKSTLAKVLAGHPSYEVTEGEIWFKGESLLDLEPEERAKRGLFMSFQYPLEIPGVSNQEFLLLAFNAVRGSALSMSEFQPLLDGAMEKMGMKSEFKERSLNDGFSGGEKKRNEILQMLLLEPSLCILDETDSGLDIDAMRVVAAGVNEMSTSDRAILLITHYQRLLELIRPDRVHVLSDGQIIRSGGAELALELEEKGYQDAVAKS